MRTTPYTIEELEPIVAKMEAMFAAAKEGLTIYDEIEEDKILERFTVLGKLSIAKQLLDTLRQLADLRTRFVTAFENEDNTALDQVYHEVRKVLGAADE